MDYLYDLPIGRGLRYREVHAEHVILKDPFMVEFWTGNPKRWIDCQLWLDELDDPVSYLSIVPYRMRFGECDIPVEGIGGVATLPTYRRKGYASILMQKAITRAAERVNVVFLNGINGFYNKLGFTTCWSKDTLKVSVKSARKLKVERSVNIREWRESDLEAAAALYNRLNSTRPCTAVREPKTYTGPRRPRDWHRGERGLVAESNGQMMGYAIFTNEMFGHTLPFEVRELSALERPAAVTIIQAVAEIASSWGYGEMIVLEPIDSLAGSLLRDIGCEVQQRYDSDGGWMGRILNRKRFIRALAPELARRASVEDPSAITALESGILVRDDGRLLRLLIGYWSWLDAKWAGEIAPMEFSGIINTWFPGGGNQILPRPFLHSVDRF
jgi:GNAT superfamily N-acetyltransferase